MKLSELIAQYGDERVQFQPLDACLISANMRGSKTQITFGTEQPLGVDGPIALGIIVWLDREEAKKIINPVRVDGPSAPVAHPAMGLTDNEKRILIELSHGHDEYCYNFRGLQKQTDLDRSAVRAACRSLRAKGLARFVRGLFDIDDGRTAGSGYGLTTEGYMAACALTSEGGAA